MIFEPRHMTTKSQKEVYIILKQLQNCLCKEMSVFNNSFPTYKKYHVEECGYMCWTVQLESR